MVRFRFWGVFNCRGAGGGGVYGSAQKSPVINECS